MKLRFLNFVLSVLSNFYRIDKVTKFKDLA
jgi:hypothetical protein